MWYPALVPYTSPSYISETKCSEIQLYHLSKNCLYLTHSHQHLHQGRKGRENEKRGEQSHRMPRNLLNLLPLNLKGKRRKIPSPSKKCRNKKTKPKVVKVKKYKFQWSKKRAAIRKCSLCSENFNSQKELNDPIAVHHKYKFLCSDRKCGKTFGSAQALKKHKLCHGEMTF